MLLDTNNFWMMFVTTFLALCLGVWLGFFGGKFIKQRTEKSGMQMGAKTFACLVGFLRIAGIVLVILCAHLLMELCHIMPVEFK